MQVSALTILGMFLTIGFIVGFIAGWWVNEKVENLGEKINPIKWFKK